MTGRDPRVLCILARWRPTWSASGLGNKKMMHYPSTRSTRRMTAIFMFITPVLESWNSRNITMREALAAIPLPATTTAIPTLITAIPPGGATGRPDPFTPTTVTARHTFILTQCRRGLDLAGMPNLWQHFSIISSLHLHL